MKGAMDLRFGRSVSYLYIHVQEPLVRGLCDWVAEGKWSLEGDLANAQLVELRNRADFRTHHSNAVYWQKRYTGHLLT
jgi:hypothetical protein